MTQPRLPTSLWIVLFLLTTTTVGRATVADPCEQDPSCRAHDTAGLALVQEKRYAEALIEFQAAYRSQAIPRLLINIGRCMYRIGRFSDAISAYEQFSTADPDADPQTKERVARYIAEAQKGLQASAKGPPPQPPVESKPGSPPYDPAMQKGMALTSSEPARAAPTAPPGIKLPVGAGVLAGLGAGVLAAGLGFGISAKQTGDVLVTHPGGFSQPLLDLAGRWNIAAISCDVMGGLILAGGLAWGIQSYVRQRQTAASAQLGKEAADETPSASAGF